MNIIAPGLENLQIDEAFQPQYRTFRFVDGQFVEAVVQKVDDTSVQLNLNGRLVTARTEIPLTLNQRICLEVVGSQSGKITLKLVGPTSSTVLERQFDPSVSSLKTLMTSWGMSGDDINLLIAEKLLSFEKAVTPKDIQAVRLLWQQMPNKDLNDLAAVTLLQVSKFPVQQETVTIANHWLETQQALVYHLTNIQDTLRQTITQLKSITLTDTALSKQLQTLENEIATITNWSIPIASSSTEISRHLSSFLKDFGTTLEAELFRMIPINPSPIAPEVENDKVNQNDGQSVVIIIDSEQAENDLELALPEKILVDDIGSESRSIKSSANTVHRLISLAWNMLSSPDIDESTTHLLRNLEDTLQKLMLDIDAHHLGNLTNLPDSFSRPAYIFPMPLTTPEGPSFAYLKVHKNVDEEKINPQNMRLALLLDLPKLGEIAINLHIFEKNITGQILSAKESTNQLVGTEISSLYDNLKERGYRISSLAANLLFDNEEFMTLSSDQAIVNTSYPSQINLEA